MAGPSQGGWDFIVNWCYQTPCGGVIDLGIGINGDSVYALLDEYFYMQEESGPWHKIHLGLDGPQRQEITFVG